MCVPSVQEHDKAATSSVEGQMSEQDLADLIVVKHSRHDKAGQYHESDEQRDAREAEVYYVHTSTLTT